jgi:hypothetical protein
LTWLEYIAGFALLGRTLVVIVNETAHVGVADRMTSVFAITVTHRATRIHHRLNNVSPPIKGIDRIQWIGLPMANSRQIRSATRLVSHTFLGQILRTNIDAFHPITRAGETAEMRIANLLARFSANVLLQAVGRA